MMATAYAILIIFILAYVVFDIVYEIQMWKLRAKATRLFEVFEHAYKTENDLLVKLNTQFARAIVGTGIQFDKCAYECIHCGAEGDAEEFKHSEGCIYVAAKEWLEEKK